jgi:hypothetical protein
MIVTRVTKHTHTHTHTHTHHTHGVLKRSANHRLLILLFFIFLYCSYRALSIIKSHNIHSNKIHCIVYYNIFKVYSVFCGIEYRVI